MKRPTPVDRDRKFEPWEMFFSSTDSRGIILSGNSVFSRISGYPVSTMMGSPHNIIRHPDMPKAVFKLLWDTIGGGNPICAYVKNMAQDGSYYWVFATVFPIEGGRYLSIRVKPLTGLLQKVSEIYREALLEERKKGVEASSALILKRVGEAGFPDYPSFMTTALIAELNARMKLLDGSKADETQTGCSSRRRAIGRVGKLQQLADSCQTDLRWALSKIGNFSNFNSVSEKSMAEVLAGFRTLWSLAINMSLSATHLGRNAATLAVIADSFRRFSFEAESNVAQFKGASQSVQGALRQSLQSCEFSLASLFLQSQMLEFFLGEIASNPEAEVAEKGNLISLFSLAFAISTRARQDLDRMSEAVDGFLKAIGETGVAVTALEIVRQTGKVEVMQLSEATESVGPHLEKLKESIGSIKGGLSEVSQAGESLSRDISFLKEAVGGLSEKYKLGREVFEEASPEASCVA